jgi:hypothetical protein
VMPNVTPVRGRPLCKSYSYNYSEGNWWINFFLLLGFSTLGKELFHHVLIPFFIYFFTCRFYFVWR